ncbi:MULTISPECIES: hypothetical protein [Halomonadaceae]|uniref:Lipoprotein n=1 Tax=Vreelandella halophila TaxID=86177 RepID=A0A9X5B595_9GAMM|nr:MULTISPECIES: hypothetical protein [Halomonas]MYL26188.1 hypothetical protein [Halomonas utahensis]MYL73250.1 hypothetical protein [Halomonas sp. 22501_18_FS]
MKRHQVLLLTTLILLLAGCSLVQPEKKTPSEPEADIDCEWTIMRGVAELVSFEENTAAMDFFPGEIRFHTEMDDRDWAPGDEFKVLLETSDHPECGEPRVRELSPLGPDA